MADIVERLRALVALRRQAGLHKSSDTEACWLEEAADEIERLRAERPPATPEARELVESLRHWLDQEPAGGFRAPDLRKAIAFIERSAAPAPEGWRPIETAPKDVPLLLWAPRERLWEPPFDNDLKCDEMRVSTTRHWTWATHWMPLPASPTAKEAEAT